MGGFNSELVFKITGDPEPLKAALEQSKADVSAASSEITSKISAEAQKQLNVVNTTQEAMRRTIAESLKLQGTSAEDATRIYKQLGLNGEQAAKEIAAAFGQATKEISAGASGARSELAKLQEEAMRAQERLAAMKANPELVASLGAAKMEMRSLNQEAQNLGGQGSASIRSMFPVLSDLRQLTRLAMGAFAVGFLISEITRLVTWIQTAASALGGFDEALQQVMVDAAKHNQELLTQFGHLNVAQLKELAGIKDANEQRRRRDEMEVANIKIQQIGLIETRKGLEVQEAGIRSVINWLDFYGGKLRWVIGLYTAGTSEIVSALTSSLYAHFSGLTKISEEHTKALDNETKAGEALIKKLDDFGKIKEKNAASVRDFAAEIEKENALLREQTTLMGQGESSPRTAAIMEAEKQINAEEKVLKEAEKARAQKKITRTEMEATEKAYADAVVAINENLQAKLAIIDAKETAVELEKQKRLDAATARENERLQKELAAQAVHEATRARIADEEVGKYIAGLQKETDADNTRAHAIESNAITAINIKLQEKVAIIKAQEEIEAAYAQAMAMEGRYAEIIMETQRRIAAAYGLAASEIDKDLNKEMAGLEKMANREQDLFARQQTRVAGHIAKLIDEVAKIRTQEQAIERVAQADRAAALAALQAAKGTDQETAARARYNQVVQQTSAEILKAKQLEKQAEIDVAEAAISSIAGIVAGKKVAAEIDAIYDTGKAIQMYARFAESYFTDGASLVSALKYTAAAAEMYQVAGSASSGASAGGSGGGGGTPSGGTGQTAGNLTPEQQQAILAPGAQSQVPSGKLHVIVMGEPNAAAFLTSMINNHVQSRDGKLVSTNTVNKPTVSTGRH